MIVINKIHFTDNYLLLCIIDDTKTILAGALFFNLGKSSSVRRACPKWLVPICISKPSSVRPSGQHITPALFTRMLILRSLAKILKTNSLTDLSWDRFNSSTTNVPIPSTVSFAFSISFFVASALVVSLQAIITRAPANRVGTILLVDNFVGGPSVIIFFCV